MSDLPFRAYPVRKSDVDQGYEIVPADQSNMYPVSNADVRLGLAKPWQVGAPVMSVDLECDD